MKRVIDCWTNSRAIFKDWGIWKKKKEKKTNRITWFNQINQKILRKSMFVERWHWYQRFYLLLIFVMVYLHVTTNLYKEICEPHLPQSFHGMKNKNENEDIFPIKELHVNAQLNTDMLYSIGRVKKTKDYWCSLEMHSFNILHKSHALLYCLLAGIMQPCKKAEHAPNLHMKKRLYKNEQILYAGYPCERQGIKRTVKNNLLRYLLYILKVPEPSEWKDNGDTKWDTEI